MTFPSFGNFINRVLKFISSQYNGVVPDGGDEPGDFSPNDPLDADFITEINGHLKDYIDALDAVKLRLGLQTIMLISMRGNSYLQSSNLGRALMTENPKRCAQVLSRAVDLIYVLSALIFPFMPATAESILQQLNAPARTVPNVLSHDILAGHTLGTPEHLFKRIDEALVEKFRLQFGGAPEAASSDAAPKPKVKKGKSAPKVDDANGPKSPEVVALEAKITEQGNVVRELKGQPKTPELEARIKAEVDVLKKLKTELSGLS